MNVHYEACTHLHRVVGQIHEAGMKAGVTLNPATPVSVLEDIAADVDLVLLMSVNPGFGGQKFIPHTLQKVAELRELLNRTGSHALIEVDGGVNLETGRKLPEPMCLWLATTSLVPQTRPGLAKCCRNCNTVYPPAREGCTTESHFLFFVVLFLSPAEVDVAGV